MQKPLAAGQGKTVSGAVLLVAVGRSVPDGLPRPLVGKIPEADGGGWAAPDPGLRRRRCRIGAGLESDGGHLVLLGLRVVGSSLVVLDVEQAAEGGPQGGGELGPAV